MEIWLIMIGKTYIQTLCVTPPHMRMKCDKTNISCISKRMEWKLEAWISLAKKTHMNMLTGWRFLLCKGSIVPSATNSKWHTLCYKVGLANNGPLDDMILVWSKCDFFSRSARMMVMIGEPHSFVEDICWRFIRFHWKLIMVKVCSGFVGD